VSDEKLRELERAFQESGSEEAELAWLRERARAGEKLDWESYSRLHELDVEAAAEYLEWRVETGDLSRDRLELAEQCRRWARAHPEDFVSDLAGQDLVAAVASAVQIVESSLADFEAELPGVTLPRLTLRCVQDWLDAPKETLRQKALESGEAAELEVTEATLYLGETSAALLAFGPAYCAFALMGPEALSNHPSGQFRVPGDALRCAIREATSVQGEEKALAAARLTAIQWLLR